MHLHYVNANSNAYIYCLTEEEREVEDEANLDKREPRRRHQGKRAGEEDTRLEAETNVQEKLREFVDESQLLVKKIYI